jgi:14-3-3 protein epsilon
MTEIFRKGDYYRYLAEFTPKPESDSCADRSLCAYKRAYQHAVSTLEPTHPTRLGLALNFSVFFHDVRKSSDRACHLAKHAFDEAIVFLTEKTALEDALRDSLMILQLLRDDLILWSSEMHRSEYSLFFFSIKHLIVVTNRSHVRLSSDP